jgi:hypothetical protein
MRLAAQDLERDQLVAGLQALRGVKATSAGSQPHFLAANSTSRALMVLAAFSAAMPLRSVPDEAAVAEVLGTLSVTVEVTFTRVDADLEGLGDDLGDLGEQPLPHLGAAMVQQDRAVGIEVDQGAGLVQVRGRERDAELHRRQGQALLQDRAAAL